SLTAACEQLMITRHLNGSQIMRRLVAALFAEMVGTFALCFVGIMAIHALKGPENNADMAPVAGVAGLIGIAVAHGLILSIMISIFGATSGGHFNPAVTVGLLIGGKIKPVDAIGYIIFQVFGGVLAGMAVMSMFPNGASVVVDGTPTIVGANGGLKVDEHAA